MQLTITGDEGTVCQWMVIGERKDKHMIDTDIVAMMVDLLEHTPTAEPEDIHDQPPLPATDKRIDLSIFILDL